jgi:threonyl-tRNA synthetase
MKELIQHVDYVEWQAKKKTKLAVELKDEQKKGRMEECLFARFATEVEDEGHEKEVAKKTVEDLIKISDQLKTKNVVFYPYVHLLYGAKPSKPKTAIEIQNLVEAGLKKNGFKVKLSPFGWYKEFEMKCKGHPLSEWSRIIRAGEDSGLEKKGAEEQKVSDAVKKEEQLKSKFYILEPTGKKHEIKIDNGKINGYNFAKYPKLEKMCLYELAKNRVVDKQPPHIELMKKLELVDYEPGSDPGNLRFYPNGRLMKGLLEDYTTQEVVDYGGMEVETPVMYDYEQPVLKKYLNRFPSRQYIVNTPNKNCFLRFSACFGQFLIAHDATISYKNLPLKIYEMTRYSFRTEKRGELAGLRRLRAFTMPDVHALCADVKSASKELLNRLNLAEKVLKGYGFDKKKDLEFAIRWVDSFEKEQPEVIKEIAKKWGRPMLVEVWDKRFFYFVMKYEINFVDALDKAATLTTDQIDVENGETYDLKYIGEDGKEHRPVILHMSPGGAIERAMYALLEKAYMDQQQGKKGTLPLWLSPTQIRICAVSDAHIKICEKMADELEKENVRVDVDDRSESVGKKISGSEKQWIPYTLVIGDKEAKAKKINVRIRESGKVEEMSLDDLVKEIKKKTEGMPFKNLSMSRSLSKRPKFTGN